MKIGMDLDGVIAKSTRKYTEGGIHKKYATCIPQIMPEKDTVIITGRKPRFKNITLEWLKKYKIKYAEIHFNDEVEKKKTFKHLAEYKIRKIEELGIDVFYEDTPEIAVIIASGASKCKVLLYYNNQIFNIINRGVLENNNKPDKPKTHILNLKLCKTCLGRCCHLRTFATEVERKSEIFNNRLNRNGLMKMNKVIGKYKWRCPFLTDVGCEIKDKKERPLTCNRYPIGYNENKDTIITNCLITQDLISRLLNEEIDFKPYCKKCEDETCIKRTEGNTEEHLLYPLIQMYNDNGNKIRRKYKLNLKCLLVKKMIRDLKE